MKIYTSYFAKLRKIPDSIVPISIAVGTPRWYNGISYEKLKPTWNLVRLIKIGGDKDIYTKIYTENILNMTNPFEVITDLSYISNNKDVVLLCYEKPTDFCHRHIVADWLNEAGFKVKVWSENDAE
jgi:uncharacterized protein (DUF488 family)